MEIREFLECLCSGIKEIPKKYQSLFHALSQYSVISKKGREFHLKETYAIGILDVVRKDLVFLKSFSSKHCKDLKLVKGFWGIGGGEIALVKIIENHKARLMSILHSPQHAKLVYLEKVKDKICALSFKDSKIIALRARQRALSMLPLHAVLKVNQNGEILEVLGVLEDESLDETIVLHSYQRSEEFSKESESLAESFGSEVYASLYPYRKDLRGLPFCTIDPLDAKDRDDAIYYDPNQQILYVAIADVSEYVSKESVIDKEARQRGFSVYLPHKSIPMLPRALSERICSLKEGEDRLALVWEMKLDNEGEVQDSAIYEAIICSHRAFSYHQINNYLLRQDSPIEGILEFYHIAQKRRVHRLKQGYTFTKEEYRLILDSNLHLQGLREEGEEGSHQLVEEAMLLANIQSAKFLEKLPCEGIYRIHQQIKESEFFDLVASLQVLGFYQKVSYTQLHQSIETMQKWAREQFLEKEVDQMIIKAQNQAQYSTTNIGHFGLGFEVYTHFTSPIRRYSDLCVHRLIKDSLKGGKRLQYLSASLDSFAKTLSELEREASRIELDYADRKFAHWAKSRLGERLEVSVIDERYPPLCIAQEKINGAKLTLLTPQRVQRFEKFEVIIQDVDLANARIYAEKI